MIDLLKINNPTRKKTRILLAPLDWGLGHATRCIPIIKELLIQKYEVWVAASGDQKALLQREFPFLSYIELPGYHIKYDKNRAFTFLRLIGSIPKILTRVKEEHRWLQLFREQVPLDAVISDNRYGLWGEGLYSVLITHQLGLRTSLGPWMDRWVQRLHYRLMGRFSAVWVPDWEEGLGLAGALSHPRRMPSPPVRYIGILSRMEYPVTASAMEPSAIGLATDDSADLMVLLSGPEPQRTILERMLWSQLGGFIGRVVFVRGLPGRGERRGEGRLKGGRLEGEQLEGLSHVRVHDHLSAADLNKVLLGAKLVLARAGYSTVMDLVRLKKKAVLIPTPGQTEQEYLGRYLAGRQIAVCVRQAGFSLANALSLAEKFNYIAVQEEGRLLTEVIAQSFPPTRLG